MIRYNCNNGVIVKSYMFQTSLAHQPGVHNCIKQSFNLSVISSVKLNCRKFVSV